MIASTPATKVVLTEFAVATFALLYAPVVFVTVKLSVPISPDRVKLVDVNVAAVFPSYGFVGLPAIDAVTVTGVMWPAPVAVVGKV